MAAYEQGTRGLLLAFRAEQQGAPLLAQPAAPVVVAPAAPEPVEVVAVAPTPEPAPVRTDAASAGTEARLPSFLADTAEVSMASHCNRVGLVTSTNGGFVTVANLNDPSFALDEQFCLART